MNFKIYNMDVIEGLKRIERQSVDCVITSPPYWGLRDYGVKGQIGLEEHPKQYLDKMVKVFSEVKKVLKPTGSVWINMGDTYFGSWGNMSREPKKNEPKGRPPQSFPKEEKWLLPKQKMLMPHRLAIAMQEDGWILRNDIVWHKPSHMPSSVRDRLTNSFEYLFHFVLKKKYYYDLDAIREPHIESSVIRNQRPLSASQNKMQARHRAFEAGEFLNPAGKNPADVWDLSEREKNLVEFFNKKGSGGNPGHGIEGSTLGSIHPSGKNPSDFWSINLEPYPEAHFACFPTKLVRKPLKATCPKQICKECGKARERIVETEYTEKTKNISKERLKGVAMRAGGESKDNTMGYLQRATAIHKTVGFSDCGCGKGFRAGIVLDPFVGSGTTLLEAQNQGKGGIGIELNPDYIPLIRKRLLGDAHQVSLNPNKLVVIK